MKRKYFLTVILILILFFIIFNKVYSQEDFNASKHFKVGKKFFESGNYKLAIKEFEKALSCDSNLQDARFLLGLCYYKENDFPKAQESLLKVISYDEKYESAYIYLAEIYVLQKKYDLALDLLKKLLKTNNFSFKADYALGVVFYKKGKLDDSIHYWGKAIEQNKNYGPCYYNLAIAFYNQDDTKGALKYLELAIKLQKKALYLYFKGKILKELERSDEAKKVFEEIIKNYPDLEFVNLSKVQILIIDNKLEPALKLLEGIQTQEANLLRGYILYKQEKLDLAKEQFRKVLEEDPLNLEAKDYLKIIGHIEQTPNEERIKEKNKRDGS